MDTVTRPALPDPIRAVIFDMDGTLIATEAAHHQAYADAAQALGVSFPEDLLASMVGITREVHEKTLARRFGPDFPLEQFYDDADLLFQAAVDAGIALRPGALLILDHFRDKGIPLALATSTMGGMAQDRLAKAGLLDYFDVIVTRTDVTHAKPHPEPYLLALQRLGMAAADCVAVEDSYAGVLSARAAGIATVMVPDLLPANEEMTLAGATVLPSLDALRELLLAPTPADS